MLFLILILCLVFIYYKLIKPHNYWKDRNVQYIKPWPIFGNIGRYVTRMSNLSDTVMDLYKANPDRRYDGIYQFLMPTLLIRDPELIKKITIQEFDCFSDPPMIISEQNENLAKRALVFLKRENGWQDMRSILSPAFTSSKIKMMFGLMDKCGNNLVDYFLEQTDAVITVEVGNTFNRIATDIIASTAFGVECNSIKDRNNEFYVLGKKIAHITGLKSLLVFVSSLSPILDKILNIRLFDAEAEAFFKKLVQETITYREENNIVRQDMLQLLMDARKNRLSNDNQKDVVDLGFSVAHESELTANKKVKTQLTEDDITAQALLFFLAGFEPSSVVLSVLSHKLARNPDVQQKLQKEIDETLITCNEKITYEALLKMKYLDCVVSETLRSTAFLIGRTTTKSIIIEPELPGETRFCIEKGTAIWIPNLALHNDPKYFPNPKKFDPERFNEENKHRIKPNTYLPFGAGPRSCIGCRFALLQVKLIIVKLLKDFDIVPVEKTVLEVKPSKGSMHFLPNEGVWLGFSKRNR